MIGSGDAPAVAALVATRDRLELLRTRSLPSIARQLRRPDLAVVVNDGDVWSDRTSGSVRRTLDGIPALLVRNNRTQGAGGAWNTGLALLLRRGYQGFVALLDDDDQWDRDHLAANAEAARTAAANIVVSGLRIRAEQGELARPLIASLADRDFLTGNPGWQGSNTFVDLHLLAEAGGFRESLRSLHDRDLAIRLLRHPAARPALVPRWTATWWIDAPGRLSDRRGTSKLSGLREFWSLYAGEMTGEERAAFLRRAEELFGFSSSEVCSSAPTAVRSAAATGDLDAETAKQL